MYFSTDPTVPLIAHSQESPGRLAISLWGASCRQARRGPLFVSTDESVCGIWSRFAQFPGAAVDVARLVVQVQIAHGQG